MNFDKLEYFDIKNLAILKEITDDGGYGKPYYGSYNLISIGGWVRVYRVERRQMSIFVSASIQGIIKTFGIIRPLVILNLIPFYPSRALFGTMG